MRPRLFFTLAIALLRRGYSYTLANIAQSVFFSTVAINRVSTDSRHRDCTGVQSIRSHHSFNMSPPHPFDPLTPGEIAKVRTLHP